MLWLSFIFFASIILINQFVIKVHIEWTCEDFCANSVAVYSSCQISKNWLRTYKVLIGPGNSDPWKTWTKTQSHRINKSGSDAVQWASWTATGNETRTHVRSWEGRSGMSVKHWLVAEDILSCFYIWEADTCWYNTKCTKKAIMRYARSLILEADTYSFEF